jgi:hypothetical protein
MNEHQKWKVKKKKKKKSIEKNKNWEGKILLSYHEYNLYIILIFSLTYTLTHLIFYIIYYKNFYIIFNRWSLLLNVIDNNT